MTTASRLRLLARSCACIVGAVALMLGTALPAAAASSGQTLFVAANGSDSSPCTMQAPCATIDHAIAVAAPGDTIEVGAGTYNEQVTITTTLTLQAQGPVIIDASGQNNGILVQGPGAAGTVVEGFQVENAYSEGILLQDTSNITLRGNLVYRVDQGMFSSSPKGECAPQGPVPGDCGEGIHLMSVSNSTIVGNTSDDNSGGILLTDEMGPTANNVIEYNYVANNLWDCGITLASHSGTAVANGQPVPSAGGIYGNQILYNESVGNGVADGSGAGILLAAAGPGGAVYNNLVQGNYVLDNGNPGVTIHSHAPNQYIAGNQILDNYFENDATEGDVTAGMHQTVGVLIWSAVAPVSGTVISGNYFADLHFGIWSENAVGTAISGNQFLSGVAVPTMTVTPPPASSHAAPASAPKPTPTSTTTTTPITTPPVLAVVESVSSSAPYTITVANNSKDYHRSAATLPVAAAWPSSDAGVTNHVTFNQVTKINGIYTYPAAPVIIYVTAANGDAVAPGTAANCSGATCTAPASMKPDTPADAFPSAGLASTDQWQATSATSTSLELEVVDSNGNAVTKNGTPYTLTVTSTDGQSFKSSNGSAFPFTKMVVGQKGAFDGLYAYTYAGQTYYAVVDMHN